MGEGAEIQPPWADAGLFLGKYCDAYPISLLPNAAYCLSFFQSIIRCGRHIAILFGERGVIESLLLQNPASDRSIADPKEPEFKFVSS
jgi:hypothetical protein